MHLREERDETNGVPWKMRGKSDNFTADNPGWIREPRIQTRARIYMQGTTTSDRCPRRRPRVIWMM